MNTLVKHTLTACLLGLTASTAQAALFTEQGDAGETLAQAQVTRGSGQLMTLKASLIDLGNQTDDVDLFKIKVVDSDQFAVSSRADLSEDNDATLYLFNTAGHQVLFDDDGDGEDLLPAFNQGSLSGFDEGIYYIGFSLLFTEPFLIGNALAGWQHDPDLFQTGNYSLSFSGTEFAAPVPVPAAAWLFASGLMVLFRQKRRAV